jgi:hypothetical protein
MNTGSLEGLANGEDAESICSRPRASLSLRCDIGGGDARYFRSDTRLAPGRIEKCDRAKRPISGNEPIHRDFGSTPQRRHHADARHPNAHEILDRTSR